MTFRAVYQSGLLDSKLVELIYGLRANGYVDVGATFNSYEIGGNTISFKVDRTFSREWGSEKALV